ncbi:MAG: IS1595 family transposase [Bryobacterales bacterium]|nr:IS1595 family transposase [Bryobacterales bacterium]
MASEPKTLQEAIIYFNDPDNCLAYLVARRWPTGVVCPTCRRTDVAFVPARRVWQCKTRHPKSQFSIKVGTIFEDSPITLDKWLLAMWMLANCKNGVSSYEIQRATGISQKSSWFMLQRIRLAMQDRNGGMLSGEVEVDESFIGGKARNMHAAKKAEKMVAGSNKGKTIAFGMVERGGKVKTAVVDRRRKKELQAQIREHVGVGSAIFSDELLSYEGLSGDYKHCVINHAIEYVRDNVHTNTMENFWSQVKRQLKGTYINVEPYHLFRYLDEQAFRYNNRRCVSTTLRHQAREFSDFFVLTPVVC